MSIPEVRYDRFYDHADLTALCAGLAAARPELVSVDRLTVTPECRDLVLLTITDPGGAAAEKPGYLVHANIHAHELATTTAALHLARALVAGRGHDETVTDLLQRVTFYIIPRLNPDNAEWALKTNGSVRSRSYPQIEPNGLTQSDIDGDGRILWMRWPDPEGEYALHPADPRLLVRRRAEDPPPYYRLVPEAEVHDPDGRPVFLAERRVDWNRQWPANWRPEHQQGGAGDFPFSEPEMHAVGRFVVDHPNLFGMLGFHTGGNAVLRLSATRDDAELDRSDVELMREVGQKGAELTGFPLLSVREYCNSYATDARLWGHFTDWTYDHLGTLSFEIELGNLYNSAGITTDRYREVTARERELFEHDALAWSEANGYDAFVEWRPFEHPQLGPIELGGWLRYMLANPALGDLPRICDGCTAFILHHAGLAPRLELRCDLTAVGGDVHRLRVEVINRGALPTHITRQATSLRGVKGVRASIDTGRAELLSRSATVDLGHLAALTGKKEVEWFVAGPPEAELTVTAASPRAGMAQATVSLGGARPVRSG